MEPQEGGSAAPDAASERDASAKRVQGAPPQLLELWSRADLADAVVDFLPAKAIAGLSVVAKPLRDAQARVVHAAARRRRVAEIVSRATFQALEAGELSHFRETWNDGSTRWKFLDSLGLEDVQQAHGYYCEIVELENTPPRLWLGREEPIDFRRGFTCKFSDVGRRVVRFRVQLSVEASLMHPHVRPFEVGCVAITGSNAAQNSPSGDDDFGTGICFVKDDPGAELGRGVSLKWFNGGYYSTLVRDVTDEVYTVDASFFYSPNPGTVWAQVSVNGGHAGRPVEILCDIPPVNFVHLYSQDDHILTYYGDIDVWCAPATFYGTGIHELESPAYSPISPDYTPTSPPYTPPVSPAHELPPTPTTPPPTGWDSD